MRHKLGVALFFLFSAGAIVVIFALVAGLVYLLAFDGYPLSWNLLSGSLFFVILAAIFWICGLAARHFLTDAEPSSPSNGNASP